MLSVVRHKAVIILAYILVGLVLITCGGGLSEPFEATTPNIIAFSADRDGYREIYVMNADGTGQTRLADNPSADRIPSWSPDGSRIAFYSNRDGNWEIYVMNSDGTGHNEADSGRWLQPRLVIRRGPIGKLR